MGLLDDAIREHLDLKRRRGADPAEVERLEREALGPVRRNTGTVATEEPEPELTADTAYDEPDNPIAADEAEVEAAYEVGGDLEPAPEPWDLDDERTRIIAPRADEPALDRDEPQTRYDEPEPPVDTGNARPHPPAAMADPNSDAPPPLELIGIDEEPFADEEPFDDDPPVPAPRAVHGETTEYDVEQALAAESPDEDDEDVLEETPEFLQDTPDHDRLWFEQRPPRDFDFDG